MLLSFQQLLLLSKEYRQAVRGVALGWGDGLGIERRCWRGFLRHRIAYLCRSSVQR